MAGKSSLFMKISYPTRKLGEVVNILPKQMVGAFLSNPPVQAKTITEKHYTGLWIKTSGIVESMDLMPDYITANFHDADGVHISANFLKPISSKVSLLNKGDRVHLVGQVFNVAKEIVVLDHCVLNTESTAVVSKVKETKSKWWERTWVQALGLLGALASILGIILYMFSK